MNEKLKRIFNSLYKIENERTVKDRKAKLDYTRQLIRDLMEETT